jgi:RHS repeat-associated protein
VFGREAFGSVWRALASGRVFRKSWPRLRRALRPKSPAHRTVAAGTALLLCVSLGIVAVVMATRTSPGAPVQQVWGSAAGRPHRVPASATMARLVNGRVVPLQVRKPADRQALAAEVQAAEAKAALPASRRARGAVPPSVTPRRPRFPVRGKANPEVARVLAAPKPAVKPGFDAQTSRLLPSLTSPGQVVYANADGTRTAMVYKSPLFFRQADGSWASIDTSLVPAAAGPAGAAGGQDGGTNAPPAVTAKPLPSPSASPDLAPSPSALPSPSGSQPTPTPPAAAAAPAPDGWRVRAAAEPESFAPYADAATLVRLPVSATQAVGFGIAGAAHAAGAASGDTVTYSAVLPDSDVRYVAGSGVVTEQVILRSRNAPATWEFPLSLTGLRATAAPDGAIEFVNAAGRAVAFVEPGFMTDSAINPRSDDGAYSSGVAYTLVSDAGRPAIRMTLDSAWLDSPARVFPVTVDPSVSDVNSGGTTYVESPNDADYSSDNEIDVGTYNGGSNVAKSFLSFPGVSSSLQNDYVLGARLAVFNTWSYSCSARPVSVYPVTSSWSVTGDKTYPGPSTGPALATKSFATGWVPLGEEQSQSACPNQWEGFDLGTAGNALLNGWTHGTIANNGLALGASATDSYGWKKFSSGNPSGTAAGDPFLAITYSTDGASYSLTSKTPVEQVTPNTNGEFAVKVTNLGSATWTPTNGYELSYEVYNASGKLVASHPVFTAMPSEVAPNSSVVVNAKVNELPVGSYAIDFDMYKDATGSSPVSFFSEGIPVLSIGLDVPQPPPAVTRVYPPDGYVSPTDLPELSTTAESTTGTTITYQFSLTCDPLPGTLCPSGTEGSGSIYTPYWTPTIPLTWDEPYTWSVTATTNGASTTIGPVTITPEVPQPDISSQLGQSGGADTSGASGGEPFDPESGNYTTTAVDAAVSVPGPLLQITRTYNSLNPSASGAFGLGWSSPLDMAVTPDNDGSGNVVVTMADGSQARFGYTGTSSSGVAQYAPPPGSPDVLTQNANGTWILGVEGGTQYEFTSAGSLSQITSPTGLTQTIADNPAGQPAAMTDTASGRSLTLTWSQPSGASFPHVASVTTPPPASGQSGETWTYSYTGDELTGVCAPAGGCTGYTYGTTTSHYATAVMDSGPRSYYRLGDPAGSTTATDNVDVNLGTTNGTYSNVTLGAAGPLAGSAATAGSFNGSSSYVSLASNLVADSSDVTIELWFKDTGDGGVLFSYDADPITDASATGDAAAHVPALYVGGNGALYGELWNGSIDPMSSSTTVNDGNWHYAVLTGSATSQSLYLDGTLVGTLSGQISQESSDYDTVGAGFWSGWPEAVSQTSPVVTTDPYAHFDGSVAEVAIYPHALGEPAIAGHYALGEQASPELTQVSMPSGRVAAQLSYDTVNDRVSSYTDNDGGTWQIAAPVASGYIASSEALPSVTRYVTVTTPAGYQEVYGYDAVNGGRLVSYTPGNGDAPRVFGYDDAGFLNVMTDSDGNLVTFTNDVHGNVLSRTWTDLAASEPCCTTYYTYYYDQSNPLDPRNDQLTGVADARSSSATSTTYLTTYAYNTAGELTAATTPPTSAFPSGNTTSYAYSTSSTSAYGGSGTVPAGLLVSQTTPAGAVTGYEYYTDGDLAQATQPDGARTVYTYDGLGRALTATTYSDTYPSGLTTSYSYNATNQPLTVTYPGVVNQVTGVTHTLQDSYTYDPDGNQLSLTQTDLTGGDPTRTTTWTYNDYGEVASVTGPAGATSGGSTQTGGASSANPQGATTGYTYDALGNVATMVDGDGNEYDYTYNEYNEVTQVTLHTPSTNQSSAASTCPAGQAPGATDGCDLVLYSYTYDPAGLLAAVTDAMGRITNYFYNANQNLIASQQQPPANSNGTVPPGRQTAYTYDGAGNLTSQAVSDLPVTAADTTTNTWAYNADDQVTTAVSDAPPSGSTSSGYADRTTSYTYNADGLTTAQTVSGTGGSTTTDYGYNGADEMTSKSVVNGSADDTTTWTYDELGQQVSMTSPDGNVSGATAADYTTNYAYDQAGNTDQVTGPPLSTVSYAAQTPATARPVTSYGYDTFGDQTQVQDPDGNVTATAYDGDGRVVSVTQPSYTPPGSSSAVTATTNYGYDEDGNLTSVTDPEGNATSYAYDALGDLVSQTDPQLTGQSAPGVWTYTYDADGEQLSATSPTGGQTQSTYDYFGDVATSTQDIRTSSVTQANTTSYTYDYLGDPLTVTTPDGAVTTNTYDHLGELATTANIYGDTTSYNYNYLGDVSNVTNPDQSYTSYGYNPAGSLTSEDQYGPPPASGIGSPLATQSYGYDASGNLTSYTDGNGHTTSYAYNAADELTSQVQPVSSSASDTTSYGYDPAGNQTEVTDARGNTTWTTYNSWNLPESVIEPATAAASTAADRTWTTAYTADGQPATVTPPGGITLSYGYDQMGDLTSESGSGTSAATPAQTFGYDLDGNLTSASAPGGTDTFTYNDAGELTATSGPSGTASFGYNGDGLMTSRTDAAGATHYTYDAADRLDTVADPLTGSTLGYGYNYNSLPATVSYAKGSTAGPKQTLAYTGLSQLASDTLTSASGATIASQSYGYDADGNLTSQATTGYAGAASTSYGYNWADELTSATTGGTTTSYGYDADGDLTQAGGTSYTYNAQDQPVSSATSAGTTSYAYTLSGALSSVTPPSGASADYGSNAYGQMVSAPGGVGYAYDGLGRLATRTTSSGTADFAYSGTGDTLASDGTTSYTYDPSGDLVAEQASGGTAAAALTDIHGDVTGAFAPASTTTSLAASAGYSPYGAVTATTGTMPSLGYQGQYTDPATGDTDMSARWYSPATSTFTSSDTGATGMPDPSAISGTPYGYVDGDPLTNTDLTGHCLTSWLDDVCAVADDVGHAVDEGFDDVAEACGEDPVCDIGAAGLPEGGWDPWYDVAFGIVALGSLAWASYDLASSGSQSSGSASSSPGASDSDPDWAYQEYQWALEHGGCTWCGYSGGSPGGSPGSSPGYYPGYGYDGGYYAYAPPPPPPPPPPPQDCYAVSQCTPPSPPSWLKEDIYQADKPTQATNPRNVPASRTIIGEPLDEDQLLQLLHESLEGLGNGDFDVNGAQSGSSSGSNALTQGASNAAGKPTTPQAAGPQGSSPQATGPQANSPQVANPVAVGAVSPSASRNNQGKAKIVADFATNNRQRGVMAAGLAGQQAPFYGGRGGAGGGKGFPTSAGCSELPSGANLIPENPAEPFNEGTAPEEISGVAEGVRAAFQGFGPATGHPVAMVGVPTASPVPAPGVVDPLSQVAYAVGFGFALFKQWLKNRNQGPGCPQG